MREVKVPELAESVTEGTVAEWLKGVGDTVQKGDPIVELETDKINLEVNSEYDGVITELLREPGETVEVGDIIAKISENGAAVIEPKNDVQEEVTVENNEPVVDEKQQEAVIKLDEKKETTVANQPIASPAARKRARELGIDLNTINGSDPLGRIRREDIEQAAMNKVTSKIEEPKQVKQPTAPAKDDGKPVERVKMSRRRQTIAKRLVEAQHTAAMLTTFNEIDMSAVMELRKRRKDSFQDKHGVKLGFMSFFTKAVVGALKQFPLLNAEIDGDELVKKLYYDIGIAVSAKEGLVVPVVRDADRLSFAEIEAEIGELGKKARDNKLTLNELQGGSFTITNGGVFGSLYSTPILNTPQVGILGMHTIQKRPVVVDQKTEQVEVRPMMYIALSYDHRIVDGAEAVQFLVAIKEMIEDPENLLLEG
ncbi:2-oxoglutarate dehydrogenase complex dihydrolipoyllysine-residue succinyltransferase [Bacillus solimangrovi]|uniref:Dihydrolipoyllysine-residue succinyltransferase component of 2-oxoglutarate dehydrogenase complex n=1 Tax=Bacillus solimangrovi TaxID=1305675 RepID=A0A1E5LF59_9BACI|nr:2-oxoglutarate dehydrogenase complex dihydrolipoyllysine-residue succinyltransferase [Bacillus solimangrovi]OEH92714.1 dihydrolipoamide succinyltransferase [Bacillus solimangrovi]